MGGFSIYCPLCGFPMSYGFTIGDIDEYAENIKDNESMTVSTDNIEDKLNKIIDENTGWTNAVTLLFDTNKTDHGYENCNGDSGFTKVSDECKTDREILITSRVVPFIALHTDCWKYIEKSKNVSLRYSDLYHWMKNSDASQIMKGTDIAKYQDQDFLFDRFILDHGTIKSPLIKGNHLKRHDQIFSSFKIKPGRVGPSISATLYNDGDILIGSDDNFWIKHDTKWKKLRTVKDEYRFRINIYENMHTDGKAFMKSLENYLSYGYNDYENVMISTVPFVVQIDKDNRDKILFIGKDNRNGIGITDIKMNSRSSNSPEIVIEIMRTEDSVETWENYKNLIIKTFELWGEVSQSGGKYGNTNKMNIVPQKVDYLKLSHFLNKCGPINIIQGSMDHGMGPKLVGGKGSGPLDKIDTDVYINQRLKEYKINACSLTVVDGCKIVFTGGFGTKTKIKGLNISSDVLSDVSSSDELSDELFDESNNIDSSTQFLAGSISKPVGALGIMILQQNGKIDIDHNITQYLESNEIKSKFTDHRITLKKLLSHTAGMSVHGFPGYNVKDPIPTIEQIIAGKKPANTDEIKIKYIPGVQYIYSGGGMTLAQLVITDHLKEKFPVIMRDTLFSSLGLECTFEQPLDTKLKNYATGYVNGAMVDSGYHIYPEMMAAGLWTSSKDLAMIGIEMCKALNDDSKIIDSGTAEKMLSPIYEKEKGQSVGIGFFLENDTFYHNGVDQGYVARFRFNRRGQGYVIMINELSENSFKFIDAVQEYVINNYDLDIKIIDRKPDLTYCKKYIGAYQHINNIDITCTVSWNDEKLRIKFSDYDLQLYPDSEKNIFRYGNDNFKGNVIFKKNRLILIQDSVPSITFTKVIDS